MLARAGRLLLVVLGLAAAVHAVSEIVATRRLLRHGVVTTGVVWRAGSRRSETVWVKLDRGAGEPEVVLPTRRAWWTWPGSHATGGPVEIVYDPLGRFDAPLFPDRARIRSRTQLWGPGLVAAAAAAICFGLLLAPRPAGRR